jgi:hypothetical protein
MIEGNGSHQEGNIQQESQISQSIPDFFKNRSMRWISKYKHEIIGTTIGLGTCALIYGGGLYLASQPVEPGLPRFATGFLGGMLITTAPLILISPLFGREVSRSVFH